MSLLFGLPAGLSEDQESAFAAIQTWAGKQDGNGKWIDAATDVASLSPALRIDGTGNSWTLSSTVQSYHNLAYMLVNATMTLSFYIGASVLTLGAGETGVYLQIPAGYRAANRFVVTAGYMINGGTALFTRIVASPSFGRYLRIERAVGNLVNDAGGAFTIQGEITFEVVAG